MAHLLLSKTTSSLFDISDPFGGSDFTPGALDRFTIGGTFTPYEDTHVWGINCTNANGGFTAGGVMEVGIWGPTNNLLRSAAISEPGVSDPAAILDIWLLKGVQYTLGCLMPAGIVMKDTAIVAGFWNSVNLVGTHLTNQTSLARPTVADGAGVNYVRKNIMIIFRQYTTYEKYEPPEPICTGAGAQFHVALPTDWFPPTYPLREWDLEYQVAPDNAQFGDWKPVITVPGAARSYTHTPTVNQPNIFFRYRYRVRTINREESDWSEAAHAGRIPVIP